MTAVDIQRETGHDWLPTVPQHWSFVSAKALFSDRREASLPGDEHLTPSQKHGVVTQAEYMETTGNRVVLNLTGADNMKRVSAGDFVIHLRSFQGGIERSAIPGKVSLAYTVLTPRCQVCGPFFGWLLKSDRYIQALRVAVNQLRDGQSIRYQDFGRIHLPLPPLPEQQTIADFLDRETAKIDALIEKQQRMVELLRERRRTAFSEVLARDPSWLHVPLRYVCHDIIDCPHWTPDVVDESEYQSVRSGCIRDGRYRPENALVVSHETHVARNRGRTVEVGDVLFAREAPAGEACLVPPRHNLSLGQRTVLLKVDPSRIDPRLVIANVYSRRVQDHFAVQMNGSTVGNLRLPVIRGTALIVPPKHLQKQLADELDETLAKIDTLIAKAERFIELARERRSALISAAVTGQIDVMGKVA